MYNFTDEQLRRYARHFRLKECGFKGQAKILESSVLIIGAGGLGSPVALYLAAAGVGHIGIIDEDAVDLSNLQRQILHTTAEIAKFPINDACVLLNKPYSYGGILRFSGQSMSIKPKQSACYACVFDSPPPEGSVPNCASAGVFGSIAGILGSIQATEV